MGEEREREEEKRREGRGKKRREEREEDFIKKSWGMGLSLAFLVVGEAQDFHLVFWPVGSPCCHFKNLVKI